MPKTISRHDAIQKGLKRYFTGTPCINSHIDERYIGGGCVTCVKSKAKKNDKQQKIRRQRITQEILRSIERVCKRRLCNNVFTPLSRKDQLFCSKRCSDIQGKEDWKIRNKEQYLESERLRKNKKYKTDESYSSKLKKRVNVRYHQLTDEQKLQRSRKFRENSNKEELREYYRKYQNRLNKEDVNHRLAGSLRALIRSALKRNATRKSKKTFELIGCSINELKKHLKKQFEKSMSWENYGDWHIDHIVPIDYFKKNFDLKDVSAQKIAFNYHNLQPMWASENMSKRNKVNKEFAEKKIKEIKRLSELN